MYTIKIMVCLALFALLFGYHPQRLEADPPVIKLTLEQKLEKVFGEKAHLMKAIAHAESDLDEKQVTHNYREDGTIKSTDCGLLQYNVKGSICPAHLLTIDGNLKAAKERLDEQGLRAWTVYRTGAYKKYM